MASLVGIRPIVFILAHGMLLAYVRQSQAQFINGANVDSCVTLAVPGVTPEPPSTSPYSIILSQNFYRPGETIQVTLRSIVPNDEVTGFIWQARLSNGGTFPVGSFQVANQNLYRTLDCTFNTLNPLASDAGTVTNVDNSVKILPLTFSYTAPSNLGGQNIVFFATVVDPGGRVFASLQSDTLDASTTNLCPTDFSVDPGSLMFALATWTLPDRPDNIVITAGPPNTSQFIMTGTTMPIQYTFRNTVSGETLVCGFVISAIVGIPNVPPVAICPADVTVFSVQGNVGNFAQFGDLVCTDTEDPAGSVPGFCDRQSGDFFQGTEANVVTCTCTDSARDSTTCTFLVTVRQFVVPNVPPVAICPADVTVFSFQGNVGNFAEFGDLVCTDNEDPVGSVPGFCDRQSGDFFQGTETNVVTCTCRDSAGDSTTCTFLVTVREFVVPNVPPVAICPADVTVFSIQGNVGNFAEFGDLVCTDNEDPVESVPGFCDRQSGDFFQGTEANVVTCTCTDSAGDSATCTFLVTVRQFVDNTPPTIRDCPDDITVNVPVGQTFVSVTWVEPTAVDDNGVATLVSRSNGPNSVFTSEKTVVTYIYADAAGNTAECTFCVNLIFVQNIPPSITCPADLTLKADTGTPGSQAVYDLPACSDPEDGVQSLSIICSTALGDFLLIGTILNSCTCTDSVGAVDTCQFSITVFENNPPAITCPDTVSAVSFQGNLGAVVEYPAPTCFDAEDVPTDLSISCSQPSGFFFQNIGPNVVSCTCTDTCDASVSCSFMVVIIMANNPPVIQCIDNVNVKVNSGVSGAIASFAPPSCFDVDQESQTLQLACTPMSNTFFPLGDTTVFCTCTDNAGESDTCSFTVNVFVNTLPSLSTCPNPVSVNSLSRDIGNLANYDVPSCFDVEDGPLSAICSPVSGSFFDIGQTLVTCTCRDSCDEIDQCSFPVTVVVANTPPVIQCIDNVNVKVNSGVSGAIASFAPPSCFDVDQESQTLQLACTPMSNTFFPVGDTTVICTCTDNAGERDTCSFTVIVFVNTPPSISCPGPVTAESISTTVGNVVDFDDGVCFDAEDGPLPTSCSSVSGRLFPIGLTTVTCTCTDSCDETDQCSFPVTVILVNTPPVIQCIDDVNFKVNSGNPGSLVPFGSPTCFDSEQSSQTLQLACTPSSNNFFPVGDTTVICTCTDNAGERDTCSFTVTVFINTPPSITCPGPVTADSISGIVGNSVNFNPPACFDAEDGTLPPDCDRSAGSFFQVGETIVTCTCTDSCDERDQCSFVVTVNALDVTPPVVTCPGDVTVEVLTGNEGSIVTFENPTAVDDFGNAFLVSDAAWYSGFYFPLGQTLDVFTYSDDAGNTATCSFTVTVIESSPCDSDPCLNGGECFAQSLTDFVCVCSGCFQGNLCQIPIPSPCTVNSCLNGGECELYSGSCQQTFCECPACTRGDRCEIVIDPCADSPCANGAQCIPDPNDCSAYSCSCVGCFTGLLCANFFDICSLNLCQNGAICQSTGGSCLSYSCTCQGCFEGFNCDRPIPNPCNNSPCQNGGFCQRQDGSCSAYSCNCLPGFSGPLCQTRTLLVSNPCNLFPCQNDGCCVSLPNREYTCLCRDGYSGIACGDLAVPANSACDSNPCANGATCFNSYSSQSPAQFYIPQYICVCPPGLSGDDCSVFTSQNTVLDQCSQSGILCRNLGTCQNTYSSFSQDIGTFCNCPEGFYGESCEFSVTNPCLSSPCRNGGQCSSFTKYFLCQCFNGFSGPTCEVDVVDINPPNIINCPGDIQVTANPGESYADVEWPDIIVVDDSGVVELLRSTALPGIYSVGVVSVIYQYQDSSGNVATCSFTLTVLPAQVVPCDSSPCLNGGTCVDLPGTFRCLCDVGFSGDQCQFGGNTLPVVTCPADITVTAFVGNAGGVVDFIPPATCIDAEDGPILETTCTASSGDFFPGIGGNDVRCDCTDSAGATGQCVFNVIVVSSTVDNEPPEVVGCPLDITVTTTSGSAEVSWTEPVARDNSGTTNLISRSHSPGQTFPLGKTTVEYTFADPTGNVAGCTFCVTVSQVGDPCDPSPCRNGGSCFLAPGTVVGFTCFCTDAFGGPACETEIVALASLPSGVLTTVTGTTNYADDVTLSYIVQGARNLQLRVVFVDISEGDVLQIGSGQEVGANDIVTLDGTNPPTQQVLNILDIYCWITFTPNNDGNTGRGFALLLTDAL